MLLDVNPADATPLYTQIARGIRRWIAVGALREGDRLPAVRELAAQARVNRNTAARAIQELEREGIVRTRVGQGTFVTGNGVASAPQALRAAIDDVLDATVAQAARLGADLDALPRDLANRIEHFRARETGGESALDEAHRGDRSRGDEPRDEGTKGEPHE